MNERKWVPTTQLKWAKVYRIENETIVEKRILIQLWIEMEHINCFGFIETTFNEWREVPESEGLFE